MVDLPNDATTPLTLADGRQILPSGDVARRPEFVEVPSNTEAQRIIVKARKNVMDIPLPAKQMNPVSIVVLYDIYGMDDDVISQYTGFAVEQLAMIRAQDAYREIYDEIVRNVLDADMEDIQAQIHNGAKKAVKRMAHLVDNAEMETVQFNAARDLLDRDGHRPVDVVEVRGRMEEHLDIVITKRDETQKMPTLDMEGVTDD